MTSVLVNAVLLLVEWEDSVEESLISLRDEDIAKLKVGPVNDAEELMVESDKTVEIVISLWADDIVVELVVKLEEYAEELMISLWGEDAATLLDGIADAAATVLDGAVDDVAALLDGVVDDVATLLVVKLEENAEELTISIWDEDAALLDGVVDDVAALLDGVVDDVATLLDGVVDDVATLLVVKLEENAELTISLWDEDAATLLVGIANVEVPVVIIVPVVIGPAELLVNPLVAVDELTTLGVWISKIVSSVVNPFRPV